jgi:uncharacterized repeat protein (TIGR03803 family)
MKRFLTTALIGSLSLPCGATFGATIFNDVHSFKGGLTDGDTPYSDLVADSEGRLYGTTFYGGTLGSGTLFRITLTKTPATVEILHSFAFSEGEGPIGGVLIGADGGLYGTTSAGGAHNDGTVYRVDPKTFKLTVLHHFNASATPADGGTPHMGLVAGPNGLLYGTTAANGPLGGGTVFAISPKGDTVHYAIIHAFGAALDGNDPYGGRLVSSGLNLFGSTLLGGQWDFGTVFELSLAKNGTWQESGHYSFGSRTNDVMSPPSGVILGKSGLLYSCAIGGNFGHGAVFSITPTKGGAPMTETMLYEFEPVDGPIPGGSCPLTFEPSGRLIGTTNFGGTHSSGTVFTLTPSGGAWTLAVPYDFSPQANDGAVEPESALIGVAGGYYVGTTPIGGVDGKGTVYRIKP